MDETDRRQYIELTLLISTEISEVMHKGKKPDAIDLKRLDLLWADLRKLYLLVGIKNPIPPQEEV